MAMYPCDVDQRRYPEAQQTIYPALVNGISSTRRKLRLCRVHFGHQLDVLNERAANSQLSLEGDEQPTCIGCGQEVTESDWGFFATVYAKGAERADYWAPVHNFCASQVMEDWSLPV